jgi:hypothetical protein
MSETFYNDRQYRKLASILRETVESQRVLRFGSLGVANLSACTEDVQTEASGESSIRLV